LRRTLSIHALLGILLLAAPMVSTAADGIWLLAPELPASGSGALLDDAARHRLLLVGGRIFGQSRGVVWTRPTDAPGRWLPLPSKNAPAGLGPYPCTILDASRDRLVIWDGWSSQLWTVSLGDTLEWSSRAIPQGPILSSPATAYDAVHRRMLLWSGYRADQQHMSAELFALSLDDDTAGWTVLPTLGPAPSPRMDAAAIVDVANDRLIVHGGRDFSNAVRHLARGDVWALPLSGAMQWTPLFTADDTPDQWYLWHAAVLDTKRQRMLVLGGVTGEYAGPSHADVKAFALDGSNAWSIAAPADLEHGGAGGAGVVVAAVYDGGTDAVYEYATPPNQTELKTRRLTLSGPPAWSELEPIPARPPARFGQAAAFDPIRKRWLSFGGRFTYYVYYEYPTYTFDDLWSFALRDRPEWELLAPQGGPPPARQDARMLYDPDGDRMILFGGQITTGVGSYGGSRGRLGTPHFHGDTWSLALGDPSVWSPIAAGGSAPGPRDGDVMVLDARRHRVLVFGGRDSLGAKGDLWSLSLDGAPEWSRLEPAGDPPSPRWQAVGCYDAIGDRLVIAGGRDATGALSDAFELGLAGPTPTWSELPTAGEAPAIESQARPYVFDEARRRLVVFGEGDDDVMPWDAPPLPVWQLTLDGPAAWSELELDGFAPREGLGSAAAMDPGGDRVAFFGGANGYFGEYGRDEHWLLSFTDAPPLVSAVLLSMETSPRRVGLVWLSPSAAWTGARVERREPTADWRELGPAVLAHGDRLTFTDAGVVPGVRYAYRLRTRVNGSDRATTETQVSVPVEPYLVLGAPQPNPASSGAVLSFTLPRAGRCEIAVFDVGGRRRELHVTSAEAPGRFELRVARALEPGLYVVRLTQGAENRVVRLCVLR
jgi:hypothetical protein